MKKIRLALLVLLLNAVMGSFCAKSADVGATPAAVEAAKAVDPDQVTEQNLLANERFWPYRVRLSTALPADASHGPVPAGLVGVLIRVEPSDLARVDFSSHGKREVPVHTTDLLERANEIRRGVLEKTEPNFVQAIQARMLDSASDELQPLRPLHVIDRRGFLCVFADPDAQGFDALAKALAPLHDQQGVMTILFPQGKHSDPKVRKQLQSLAWPVPFVIGYLSEPYTLTLLPEGAPLPYVMLQTPEGRVLFQGPWLGDASQLLAAFDQAFGAVEVPSVADRGPAS